MCLTIIMLIITSITLPYKAEAAGTVSEVTTLESPHNYTNNYQNSWTRTVVGAVKIRVHFSRISMERYYDYLYTSANDSWSGQLTDVWSGWVYGDTIKITMITDGATTDWGFKIDKVEYYTGNNTSETKWSTIDLNYVVHNMYGDNENKYWQISKTGAKAIRVHFKEIDIKTGDYLYIDTPNYSVYPKIWREEVHGNRSGVWSSWIPGDKMDLAFKSNADGVTGRGFIIDYMEYMTSTKSDFPWTNIQFNEVPLYEVNPDFGDAERRLSDRKIYLPSEGSVHFYDNLYTVTVDGVDWPDRTTVVNFMFSPERLNNLVRDGNETVEIETIFYNEGPPASGVDPYGRPLNSFYPWMTTIAPALSENQITSDTGAKRYDDVWASLINPTDSADRGTYFYRTNLPSSHYPDTLYPKLGKYLNFSVGVADAQQLKPNIKYYWEIVGGKGTAPTKGIFNVSVQRGYKFSHNAMPNSPEFYVWNEEWDTANEVGSHDILLNRAMTVNKSGQLVTEYPQWRLGDIINITDSRYDNIFASNGYSFSWNANGDIQINTGSGYQSTKITRNWGIWNTNEFNARTSTQVIENN